MTVNDTIAAVSTPRGRGGIAVIRISGPEAVGVASGVFVPRSGKPLSSVKANTAVYGGLYHRGRLIDDGLATIFYAPRSFTGEDTVELSCHGGVLLSQMVLEAALLCGARPALAGEFTRRAFVAGKIDLTRAEAAANLIEAQTEEKILLSAAQADGVLARRVGELRSALLGAAASVYAYIDYPDEDLAELSPSALAERLSEVGRGLDALLSTCRAGRAVAEGVETVIAGPPNTGKSSLLNLLCAGDRAIVSPIAGTTRDTIEETVAAGKVLLRLCDTAGLREAADPIEREGIARAERKLDSASLVLAVFDGSREPERAELLWAQKLRAAQGQEKAGVICVINKADLPSSPGADKLKAMFERSVTLSCLTGEGKEKLIAMIEELFDAGKADYRNDAVLSNARQYAAAAAAKNHVEDALAALNAGYTPDIAGFDIEKAAAALGELDGRTVSSEIADEIFHRFCVGK